MCRPFERRHAGHGHGHGYGHGRGSCHCGSGFHRRFFSPEEERKQLEAYKEQLQKEQEQVEERLKKYKS